MNHFKLVRKTAFLSIPLAFATAAAVLAAGCESGPETYDYDYLRANGFVAEADGQTPIPGVAIGEYDWVVSYTDGSTVAVPFATPGVVTDGTGSFSIASDKLSLQSGNQETSCTDVCTATDTVEIDECYDWETEYGDEYCADWEYDENGDEYCADWEQDETDVCVDWEPTYDTECVEWGTDCDYYYPSRNIDDIAQAYSQISYTYGDSAVTTVSRDITFPAGAVTSTSTQLNSAGDTELDRLWTQNDFFVTPISHAALSARIAQAKALNNTPARQQLTAAHNASRVKKAPTHRHVSRDKAMRKRITAAKKLPIAQIMGDKAKWDKVLKARSGCGAIKKSANQ
jgi:hypothetical protein